jgi:hypothetical protein
MNFDSVEKIAAAILYEGYILYPYRPTAIKNRQRWNFGTLYPRVYAEAQRPEEPFRLVAECLATADAGAKLDLRISFLQLIRQGQSLSPADAEALKLLTDPSLGWDEGVERTSEHSNLQLSDLLAQPLSLTLQMDATGLPEGRSNDVAPNLQIELTIEAEAHPDGACKLRIQVQNTSPLASGAGATRDEALPVSLVSAHLLLV